MKTKLGIEQYIGALYDLYRVAKIRKEMLIFAEILRPGFNSQIMEADTLTKIDTTARLDTPTFPDSTAVMLSDWHYSKDSSLLLNSKSWLGEYAIFFNQKDAYRISRHDGIVRSDKTISESLLLLLLLMQILLVAYLIKNGLKYIGETFKNVFVSDERGGFSVDLTTTGSHYNRFLWGLGLVVFSLLLPVIRSTTDNTVSYSLDSWLILRCFIFIIIYFATKELIFRALGMIFFSAIQTESWISISKTVLSFYALIITPVLICAEIGIQMKYSFVFAWVVGFLIIAKFWLLIKTFNIFSIRNGDFFYLILYLCTLEILPVLLLYKGIFLL